MELFRFCLTRGYRCKKLLFLFLILLETYSRFSCWVIMRSAFISCVGLCQKWYYAEQLFAFKEIYFRFIIAIIDDPITLTIRSIQFT